MEAWEQYGGMSLPKVLLPSMIGIPVQTFKPRERKVKKEISISDKIWGEKIERKITLTDEQYNDYQKLVKDLNDKKMAAVEKLNEFKDADVDFQVAVRKMVYNAAVREAQKKIEAKYRNKFPKITDEEKEDLKKKIQDKKNKKNIKDAISGSKK